MTELGALVAQYGPFRIHEWYYERRDGSRGTAGNYVIVTSSDVTGEFIITLTRGLTSDRDAMIVRLEAWLNTQRNQLIIRRQEQALRRTPEGMRDLQEAMDADRHESGEWSTPPRTAAELIAYAEQEIAVLQRRYDLVEQGLRELERGEPASGR